MSTPETIAQSWLRYANSWLNYFGETALSDPANLLLDKLRDKQKHSESKHAWDIINDLKRLSDRSDEKESAEIRLHCGLVAAEMGYFRDALRLLSEASSKYINYKHQRSVAQWMVGCAQWLLPDKEVDAINSWQISMKAFEDLRDHNKNNKAPSEWYRIRCEEMFNALHCATEKYEIPPLPDGADDWIPDADDAARSEQPVNSSDFESRSNSGSFSWNRLGAFPVYSYITAGKFASSNMLEDSTGLLEIDVVLINDIPHRIYSLIGGKIVKLPGTHNYYVLQVFGDSMNQAKPTPIKDGDYVLMRQQAQAGNGDIVAAEIVSGGNQDNRATLKRFRMSSGKVFLIPESDNPQFESSLNPVESFTKFDQGFHIRGVALAVFKKL